MAAGEPLSWITQCLVWTDTFWLLAIFARGQYALASPISTEFRVFFQDAQALSSPLAAPSLLTHS